MALTKKQLATALTRDFETTLNSYASGEARAMKKQCDRLANRWPKKPRLAGLRLENEH